MKILKLTFFLYIAGCYQSGVLMDEDTSTGTESGKDADSNPNKNTTSTDTAVSEQSTSTDVVDSESAITDTADSEQGTSTNLVDSESAIPDTSSMPVEDPRIPSVRPDVVEMDAFGVIYMLVKSDNEVYRYSVEAGDWLQQIDLNYGSTVSSMTVLDAHERLYLGFVDGDIRYLDSGSANITQLFVTADHAVYGLGVAGNYLLAQGSSPNSTAEYHWFYAMDGSQTDSDDFAEYSRAYVWNPALEKTFFFGDNSIPNDLHFEEIDQSNGCIVDKGDTPYHGDYDMEPPLVVSPDGAFVLVGTGDIYDAATLERRFSLNTGMVDAVWTRTSDILVLDWSTSGSLLQSISPEGEVHDTEQVTGDPIAVTRHSDGNVYAVTLNDGQVKVTKSTIVEVMAEADMNPNIPTLVPNMVEVDEDGIIYFMVKNMRTVYRYSTTDCVWLQPLFLTGTESIQAMAVSNIRQRLYIGYGNGDIYYIDWTEDAAEHYLASTELSVLFLESVGEYIIAQDSDTMAQGTCWLYSADGVLIDFRESNYRSRESEWNPVLERIYYLIDHLVPKNIAYFEISPDPPGFNGGGASPYHGDYEIEPPIVISSDGVHVLLGSGDIYNAETLEWETNISAKFIDATWAANDAIHMLTYSSTNAEVFTVSLDGAILDTQQIYGTPVKLIKTTDKSVYVITSLNGQITVTKVGI